MSGDVMNFPDNWWKFVQQYQFADKEEVYTNGSMLIPSFRVRQMVEHYFGGKVGKTSHRAERTCECIAEYAKSPIDGKTIVLHRCSACHELMRPHMNYCPNCGARIMGK